MFEASV